MVLLMRALHLELHLEQGEGKLVMALEMKGMRAQMTLVNPHRDMKLMKRAAVDNSRCGAHMLVINQWVLMRVLRRVLSLSLRESFTGYG